MENENLNEKIKENFRNINENLDKTIEKINELNNNRLSRWFLC